MHHISTKQIETELGLASMWTNTYEPTVNCDGLDSMSAACPLIVYPDVCSPLGYPTRDQGVRAPEMTFGKIMIKALKTSDIDPKHWFAMAATTGVQVGT